MILIGNGRLITRNSNNDFYENGAVVIDGKKIIDVGEYNLLKEKYKGAEFIDAKNKLIMPSYINCHEHIYSAFARGLQIKKYNPNGFLDILNGLWWTIDRNLTLHDIYLSAMATFIDSIKCGVTTTFDHHASFGSIIGSLKEIEKARIETGMRACLCYEISDRDGMDKSKESVLENIDFIKYVINDKSDMVKAMMGMHAQFTISDETFKFAMENKPKEVGVHIHVAEGIEDLQDSLNKHGKRIVDRLYDFGVLSEKTLLAHCIYVNEHEMDLIRDTNTMVVHNPESNMGNACGCPPVMRMMEKGIVCGLGTDGYTHDMLESYKVANILHKHHLCNPNAAWSEVPKMLFENNRIIANRYFDNKLGVIENGAFADIIIVDYNPLTPMNKDNVNSHIVFGISGRDTITTICSGKVLMKDKILLTVDEKKVMEECRMAAKELGERINSGK